MLLSLTNAQDRFKMVLILPIFHTFLVSSQNTLFLSRSLYVIHLKFCLRVLEHLE